MLLLTAMDKVGQIQIIASAIVLVLPACQVLMLIPHATALAKKLVPLQKFWLAHNTFVDANVPTLAILDTLEMSLPALALALLTALTEPSTTPTALVVLAILLGPKTLTDVALSVH